MNKKILFIVITFTLAAIALLAIRQEQINVVHKISGIHIEIEQIRMATEELRIQIEAETSPQIIRNPRSKSEITLHAE